MIKTFLPLFMFFAAALPFLQICVQEYNIQVTSSEFVGLFVNLKFQVHSCRLATLTCFNNALSLSLMFLMTILYFKLYYFNI